MFGSKNSLYLFQKPRMPKYTTDNLITNNIPENQGAAAAQRKGVERNK
jgi:hypothetical protein